MQPDITLPPKKPVLKRNLLIAGVVLIIIGIGLNLYQHQPSNSPTCFTTSDYIDFYHSTPGEAVLGPGTTFFTHSYPFVPATTTLDTTDSTISASQDSTEIAAFYKEHTTRAMVFTIESAYLIGPNADGSIAEKRTELLKKLLTDAGIPAELITTKTHAYEIDEDGTSAYDDIDNATITLSSAETCHE